ncbi:MAG: response regulator [bacterium]
MTRLLFVEDEPRGVDAYFPVLRRSDFQCDLAKSFDESVEKLQNGQYDGLSLDIMFMSKRSGQDAGNPQSAGLDLLKLIRKGKIHNCDPMLKVIVLTASGNNEIKSKVKALGVYAYLTKPVDYKRVMDTYLALKNV